MKKLLTLGVSFGLLGLSLNATSVAYYEFNGTGTATVGSTITVCLPTLADQPVVNLT